MIEDLIDFITYAFVGMFCTVIALMPFILLFLFLAGLMFVAGEVLQGVVEVMR